MHLPGCEDPPITFIVERLTDLLNLDILISAKNRSNVESCLSHVREKLR